MSWEILLNNTPHTFTTDDLPALVHAEGGHGAGLFCLNLLLQLYHQGEPLLILSSGKDFKNTFLTQCKKTDDIAEVDSVDSLSNLSNKQVLFLSVENQSLIPSLMQSLEDFSDRIVYIGKFQAFSKEIITQLYGHPNTIYCGDLNISEAKEPLLQLKYNTKIFFSPLHNDFRLHLPEDLPQYHGYYQGRIDQGTVHLQET